VRELTKKERFNDKVLSRFNLYNSIFSTLPYESISKTGVMLPLFERICIDGYKKSNNPTQIVNDFFDTYMMDLMIRRRFPCYFVSYNISKDR